MIVPRNPLKCLSILKSQMQLFSHTVCALEKPEKLNNTVFIRHAHSEFNKACQDYRKSNKIDYDWEALCRHPGFEDLVAYNPDFIDCPLTEKGIQQCYTTAHKVNFKDIDVILVSPHERALQTCEKMLKFSNCNGKIPVIVQPLICGSLWSSCDISKCVSQKVKLFSSFDFSRMINQPQLWFIQNLRLQDKLKVYDQIKKRRITSYRDKQLLVLEMIREKQFQENCQILRHRSWQIKMFMKELQQKYCNILSISHYYVIQYVNTKAFNDVDNKPIDDVDLKNCFPYYNNLEQLLCCR